jgi:hypothetical protein
MRRVREAGTLRPIHSHAKARHSAAHPAGGVLVLVLGVFIAFETSQMQVELTDVAVGPRLFPFLVAGGLILVAAALLREAFFGHVAHEGGFELD